MAGATVTRVLGLDLSLTATGFAYNDEVVGVIRSKAKGEQIGRAHV